MKVPYVLHHRGVVVAPPKYMQILDILREGDATASAIGNEMLRGAPHVTKTGRTTSLVLGRLYALEKVGAVERITSDVHGDDETARPQITWRITEAGRGAIC